MVNFAIINELKENFQFILQDPRIFGLILYGSVAEGTNYQESDIDLCFVIPEYKPLLDIYHFIMEHAKILRDEYDIRFFEEFSLPLKIEVMNKGIVILTNDVNGLYEYFFRYRKLWEESIFRCKYLI
ncbi:MAG: nucleotidyltransferase family protein [Promethearchaeota archaeon]